MRGLVISLLLSVSFFLVYPLLSNAAPKPLPRKIIAFYDDQRHSDIQATNIHLFAEMPLNHLGMEVIYKSIHQPLPSNAEMESVQGILTWFYEEKVFTNPTPYCTWINTHLKRGKKLVIFGALGFYDSNSQTPLVTPCKNVLQTLGIKHLNEFSKYPLFLEVTYKDPKMVEFERKMDLTETLNYTLYKPVTKKVKPYLIIKRTDMPNSKSTLVFTSPKGGLVTESYAIYQSEALEKTQWRINPFRFFDEAFGLRNRPRPDTTTINGKRIFYTHIDGDGIFNITRIDRKRYSGEIIYEEILKKYSTLPITASIITGYLDIKKFNGKRAQTLYKNMFKMPNIEVASHGYAHPINWRFGLPESNTVASTHPFPAIYDKAAGELALKVPDYLYSPQKETVGSIEMIRDLLAKMKIDKKVDLFLWTGFCNPNESMVGMLTQSNILNMNGGDTRFDSAYPSYSTVYPLSIMRGKYRQIYASSMNENVYTNYQEGPYFAYAHVIDTYKNTESPLRVKPINIYYHYYSGERVESLSALKKAYNYAFSQEIFPIHTSDYARLVQDSFDTNITALADGGFLIQNEGFLRTIRFDQEERNVDFHRSTGVNGFKHFQGNLYVFLDASQKHKIYLTKAGPTQPFVVDASAWVQKLLGTQTKLSFSKKGWFKSSVTLGGLKPSTQYRVVSKAYTFLAKSNAIGQLELNFTKSELGQYFEDVTLIAAK